jgi:hypothetical protein
MSSGEHGPAIESALGLDGMFEGYMAAVALYPPTAHDLAAKESLR